MTNNTDESCDTEWHDCTIPMLKNTKLKALKDFAYPITKEVRRLIHHFKLIMTVVHWAIYVIPDQAPAIKFQNLSFTKLKNIYININSLHSTDAQL